MTARQAWEYMLIEINKVTSPTMLIEDFNHLINRGIYQFLNKRYIMYDMNQQTSDDLRVLKASATLSPELPYSDLALKGEDLEMISQLCGASYEVTLPSDYFHMLGCICLYEIVNPKKGCEGKSKYVKFPARRLTADMEPQIINNSYFKPSYKTPYYYINNINTSTEVPTYPYKDNRGTDINGTYKVTSLLGDAEGDNSNLPRTIIIGGESVSTVDREIAVRYGNASTVRMEIKCGESTAYKLVKVRIDYIKVPQTVMLTKEQLDLTEDTSQILEFPDYICLEILKELVSIVLENSGDPRIQTYSPVNPPLAPPTQLLAQTKK